MIKVFGGRGASAVIGIVHACHRVSARARRQCAGLCEAERLGGGPVARRRSAARPLGRHRQVAIDGPGGRAATTAAANAAGAVFQPQPRSRSRVSLRQSIATRGRLALQGRLAALCARRQVRDRRAARRARANCLATAVYFEARGESLEGQLAVARVVMNRAASGRYPPDWCSVVKQPAQFSFVRHGEFPAVDTALRRMGAGPGRSPASRSPMSCRASVPTSCGITRITSRRRGAVASAWSRRSARTSSTARNAA